MFFFIVTDEIGNQASVRNSSSRNLEKGLTIWKEIGSGGSIDIVVVSDIEQRISEHEQSSLVRDEIVIILFAVD